MALDLEQFGACRFFIFFRELKIKDRFNCFIYNINVVRICVIKMAEVNEVVQTKESIK